MARDSQITLPNGDKISGNWATEQTLENILNVLEKKHGVKSKSTPEEKDNATKLKLNSKSLNRLSEKYKQTKEAIQQQIKSSKSLIESDSKLKEAFDVTTDVVGLAGKGFNALRTGTSNLLDEMDKLDGSVSGANTAFFKVVGSAGMVGTAFGVAAGIIDQFADFQTAALQTGFSFSQELVNTRTKIADVGMNMQQLSTILVANGEAVRSLGGNGAESAATFIDLVGAVKDSARQFGLFGMTSEEIAGVTAERLDLLRKQGFVEKQAYDTTLSSFTLLNQEVLGYAKLTGRERREIMRNNLAMREGSELMLADLAKLGPNATVSFDSIMQSMSAVFGQGGDEFAGIFSSMVESHFMNGMERLSSDQLAALGQIPGLKDLFEDARDQFITNADNPKAMQQIQLEFANRAGTMIQDATDSGLVALARLQEDDPVGQVLKSIIGAGQAATNFLQQSNIEQTAAFNTVMAQSESQMLQLRERIQTLQNEFQAALIRGLGFGQLEDMLDDKNFARASSGLTEFGDALTRIREGIVELGNMFGDTGSITTALVLGIGGMFAAQGAVTLAMISGANLMWSGVRAALSLSSTSASAGASGIGAAGAAGAASNTPKGKLSFSKGLAGGTALSALIGGAMGAFDTEKQDANMHLLGRINSGAIEGILGSFDFLANLVNSSLGVQDYVGKANLAGMAREFELSNSRKIQDLANQKNSIPVFDPATQRVNTDNMITKGALLDEKGNIRTQVSDDNKWRHPDRGEEYLKQLADIAAKQTAILERINRTIEDGQ